MDGKARTWLANQGYDPAYGARPLKRVIQRTVQDPLAGQILAGKVVDGAEVKITAKGEGLVVNGEVVKGRSSSGSRLTLRTLCVMAATAAVTELESRDSTVEFGPLARSSGYACPAVVKCLTLGFARTILCHRPDRRLFANASSR